MIEFIIPGNPIGKKRPRFARRGKFITIYSDQETEEGKFINQIQFQFGDHRIYDGPIHVNLFFHIPRPKGHFRTGKNAHLIRETAPSYPVSKPDIDNMEKFVFDCLNSIVYKDDSQIVSVRSIKVYGDPKTIIQIEEIV